MGSEHDADVVRNWLADWLPNASTRRMVADTFALGIDTANAAGASRWSLSVRQDKKKLTLSIGRTLAVRLTPKGFFVSVIKAAVLPETLSEAVSNDWVAPWPLASMGNEASSLQVPYDEIERFTPLVLDGLRTFSVRAAQTVAQTPFYRSHADEAVGALEEVVGHKLPRPSFSIVADEEVEAPWDEEEEDDSARGNGAFPAVFKVSPGEEAVLWEQWKEGGYASVGWEPLGDVGGFTDAQFEKAWKERGESHGWTLPGTRQLLRFSRITPGTIILANEGRRRVLGIGIVTGSYYFVAGRHGHRLPVMWLDDTPRDVGTFGAGWSSAVIRVPETKLRGIAPDIDEVLARAPKPSAQPSDAPAEKHAAEPAAGNAQAVTGITHSTYTIADLHSETGLEQAELDRWYRALLQKKQIVLHGPPGTGKTFLAERLAKARLSGTRGFSRTIQFHAAVTYEDFIQGLRPEPTPTGLAFSLRRGTFLQFLEEARRVGDDPAVLIIDELNRANVPRVFGELMYLLEYRDRDLQLAGGGSLRIPSNVSIIGTMNTADRSIARLDAALRRRFAFLRLAPEYAVLKHHLGEHPQVDALISTLQKVNAAIGDPDHHIGVSFFLDKKAGNLADRLEDVWQLEIEPLLEEHFLDQPTRVDEFRWKTLKTGALAAWASSGLAA